MHINCDFCSFGNLKAVNKILSLINPCQHYLTTQEQFSLQNAFHGDAWTLSMLNMDTFIEKNVEFYTSSSCY